MLKSPSGRSSQILQPESSTMPATYRVLYAEDDRAIRESVVRALELEGYDVNAVRDGMLLLEKLETYEPNVIILDVMMPFMDGLSACRRLRSSGRTGPRARCVPNISPSPRCPLRSPTWPARWRQRD